MFISFYTTTYFYAKNTIFTEIYASFLFLYSQEVKLASEDQLPNSKIKLLKEDRALTILYMSLKMSHRGNSWRLKLVTREFELETCGFKLVAKEFQLVTCKFELMDFNSHFRNSIHAFKLSIHYW